MFVVGSPRSGTSVLTWCLGQHSNLLALEESGWMGDFAADLGARYAAGSRRGERSQLVAMGVDRDAFMAEFGRAIDGLVARHRARLQDPCAAGGKARWIDGTPEYSLHIGGLIKLFPAAKFVHIVREVDAVVASMLNFHRLNGERLVADPAHAYAYWMRAVEACVAAERALGGEVVHRLRYADLVERTERTVAAALAFLGEPYEAHCCEPMRVRINSSDVPRDFVADTSRVDPQLLRAARELSLSLQQPSCGREAFGCTPASFRDAFEARVGYVAALDDEYAAAQREVTRLNAELDRANAWARRSDAAMRRRDGRIFEMQSELAESTRWALRLDRLLDRFGLVLVAQCLLSAVALLAVEGAPRLASLTAMAALLWSCAGVLAWAWMRRARFLPALRRLRGRLRVFRFH